MEGRAFRGFIMTKLVFLLEERSTKEMLNTLLPKIIPSDKFSFLCIPHEGKSNLKKSIPVKLRAWREPNVKFIIICDKDSSDCKVLKNEINKLVNSTKYSNTLIRIICTELESWYLGDLNAVSKAFSIDLTKKINKPIYQNPDVLSNAKQELRRLVPLYQPISGSKYISKYMDINKNKSKSFQVFISGVRKICSA